MVGGIVDPRDAIGEDIETVPVPPGALRRHPCFLGAFGVALGCGSPKAVSAPSEAEPAESRRPPIATPAPEPAAAPPSASVLAPSPTSPGAALVSESETPEARLAFWKALFQSPRHRPSALDAAPRSASLPPGPYACRVSREYRLRDCRVEQTAEGRTFLDVAEGNLLGMRGVLWDEGAALRFEGWLTEEQPFGCTSCQDRCYAYPGSCACDPLPPEAIRECLSQPLRVTFRPAGKSRFQGTLDYSVYSNEYTGEGSARRAQGYTAKPEKLEVLLVRGTPPAPRK